MLILKLWNNQRFFKYFFVVIAFNILSSCDFFLQRVLVKPVVQVEDLKLSTKVFAEKLSARLKDLDSLTAKDPKIIDVFKNQIVNDFIIKSLVELWLKENSIYLEENALQDELNKMIALYPTESAFKESLTESGQSYSDWKDAVEARLKRALLAQHINKGSPEPEEPELLAYYESNKERFVLAESILLGGIQLSDISQAETLKKLLKKQDFFELAKTYSTAYTSTNKGLFGSIEKGFSAETDKAFKMPVGKVFGPEQVHGQLYLFKIKEKQSAKKRSFEEVRHLVKNDVLRLRQSAKFSAWLDEQIKKYSIKKNLDVLNSVRVETH